MIAFIEGTLVKKTVSTVVVATASGVGYELFVPVNDIQQMPANGSKVLLHTYLQVKEDGMTLFGFDTPQEKELFLKLISVSGVGPKMGISILASLTADEFAIAVATADTKRLSKVKGLGKKTAEKIILELHGKISAAEVLGASGDDLTPSVKTPTASIKLSAADEEAVSALMGLGFTRTESAQAVKKARDLGAGTVEEVIIKALQGF